MRDTDELAPAQDAVSLGSFGAVTDTVEPADPVNLTFTWYGEVIRVNADASDLDLVEFMGLVGDVDERRYSDVLPAFHTLLRRYVHPDDWRSFWQLCRVHRSDPVGDFLPLIRTISEAVAQQRAGRPTVRPSGSTGGPSTIGRSSTVDSTLAVLDSLAHRGDLAEFVVQAQDYRAQHTG